MAKDRKLPLNPPADYDWQAETEIYGIGNHGPDSWCHSPLDAFNMSQTISYPPAHHDRWYKFLQSAVVSRQYDDEMDHDGIAMLESLDPVVTLYRGVRRHYVDLKSVSHFSWTLKLDVANWFAENRLWGCQDSPSVVLRADVDKRRIVWVILDRDEYEAVIFPGPLPGLPELEITIL